MKNKSQFYFAGSYLAFSAVGCIWSFFNDDHFILYFTNLSNYFCFLVMLTEFFRLYKGKPLSKSFQIVHFCAMMSLMITGLVYNTLLKTPFEDGYWTNYHSLIMHVICPALIIIYYFKYKLGATLAFKHLWWCVAAPYAYMAMIFSRQLVTHDRWYPYFFLNPDKEGIAGVCQWIAILSLVFIVLGTVALFCSHRSKAK